MLSMDRRTVSHFDWPFLGCILLILFLGLLNLYSSTFNLPAAKYWKNQLLWSGIGLAIMIPVVSIDYRILRRLAYPLYGAILFSLVAVLFFGKTALGAQRWLSFGPLSIQPSELAKIGVILGLAKYFHSHPEKVPFGFKQLIKPFLLGFLPFVFILKQPDLGTAIVLGVVAICMTLFMGVRKVVLISFLSIFLSATPVIWTMVLKPYQKDRIITFLNPEKDPLGKGYQAIQSKIAIGSGELLGKGFLKGTQSKLQFLPKQHTDFAFSNFAEEFGFVGSIFLVGLYASLTLLGLSISLRAKDPFGMILSFGLTALVSCQAFINLGMETGLLPVVGITLPLFSYGGTSLLTTFVALGLLLNISIRRYMF